MGGGELGRRISQVAWGRKDSSLEVIQGSVRIASSLGGYHPSLP